MVENHNKDFQFEAGGDEAQKTANNGFLWNTGRTVGGENGGSGGQDVDVTGVLLEDRSLNNGPTTKSMIVNFGPTGATTRTSISRHYTLGSVYKEPRLRNRLIVLAVAFMVLGAAFGALTIYFAGTPNCLQGRSIYYYFIFRFRFRTA